MPIIKAGFSPGAHGRKVQASFGRRVAYLTANHDRDQALLLDGRGEEISRGEALEAFGGKDAAYHELIVAPSATECRALEERFGGAEEAQKAMARMLAERLSPDRPCVAAVHTHGDRWHLHLPMQGEARPELLGERGEAQRAWDEALRASRPKERIVDWEAHRRGEGLREELKGVARAQRALDRARFEALRSERNPARKLELSEAFARKGRELVQRRYGLELGFAQARYESRGWAGSWDHRVEIEKAEQRRSRGENRIARQAEQTRERIAGRAVVGQVRGAARRTDRTLAQGRERALRATERSVGLASRVVAAGVGRALHELGVPREAQWLAHAGLKVAQEAVRLATRGVQVAARAGWDVGKEVAPAVGRQAAHAAKVTAELSVGAALAVPTLGQSLVVAGKESGRDALAAGKDLAQDGAKVGLTAAREAGRAGAEVLQEGLRSATSLGLEALPRPLREGVRAALEVGKTGGRVVADLAQLDPVAAGLSLGKGGLEVAAAGARGLGEGAKLPEVVRLPLGALEQVPVAGLAVKAARVAGEVVQTLMQERGFELER